jgi:FAD/FMN-containing dehydrogenase
MTETGQLLDQLRAVVGPPNVIVDADERASYEVDWTRRFRGEALAVVRPASTAETVAVVRACHEHGARMVPQGGNTGLVGGSVPRGGEVVVSTRRMDEIGPLDDDAGEIVVGSGAVLEAVQAAVRPAGWDVGVDLGARGSCTIGGMVATNAGGEHVVRDGPMAEQVLGLEGVLAGGAVVGRVPALRKDNTGYRWHRILTGSEGTLAVITRVHLRLVRRPKAQVTALVGLASFPDALALAGAFHRDIEGLDALEAFFADGLDFVQQHIDLADPFPQPAAAYLLAEAGAAETDEAVREMGATVEAARGVVGAAVATDAAGRARLWRYREAHPEVANSSGIPHKLDVTLPFDALPRFPDEVRRRIAAVAPDARVLLFGHVGDGNLHVNVLGPAPEDYAVDDAVLGLVVELGGSISAEHGVGIAKRDWLARYRTADDLEAMRAVKRALDPQGLLNPGVIFTP